MTDMWSRTVNIPLLRKAVEWVEEQEKRPLHQRQWNQGHYVHYNIWAGLKVDDLGYCGTTYCVAGYVGQLLEPRYSDDALPVGRLGEPDLPHVNDFAAEALGLTTPQADLLFSGSNTASQVRRIAERLAGEKL
jgi:hypothetical protein